MLRASINDSDNPLILMGLSEGNIELLKADKPILAEIRSFGVDLPGRIAIVYGKTEEAIAQRFRERGLLADDAPSTVDPRPAQEEAVPIPRGAQHKHILICLCGLPRSGKSTWARSQTSPIVNPDSIRLAMHGQRFVGLAEPWVWAMARTMVRSLFLAGHKHVILDATGITRKRRDEWRSAEWALFWKHINTSKEVCLERAKAENDAEIIPVIERMSAQWEPLGEDEQCW